MLESGVQSELMQTDISRIFYFNFFSESESNTDSLDHRHLVHLVGYYIKTETTYITHIVINQLYYVSKNAAIL